MNETIYMAELVGISSHIELDSNGLLIIIKGFSDSVTKYIYCLINEIKEFIKLNDKKNTFEIYLEKRTKDYLNFFKTKPYKLSNYIKSVILMKNGIRYSIESLYSNIKLITFEKFVEFEKNWLQNLSFLWFINGNISSIQAETLITKTEAELRSINMNSNQNKIEINILKLIENQPILYEHYISKIITDYEDNNSSLQLYYEGEKNDPLSVLKSKIIGRYLADPFFDELRTDKQLGYVVQSFEENFRGILGFNFLIMSSMYNSYYVSEKVREFLFAMNDKLKIMNEDDFEELKESVLDEVLCKDNNIFEESGKMWEEIRTNQFLFNRSKLILIIFVIFIYL